MSIITGKIDVTKIEKDRLFKGKKGTYLDVVIFLNQEKDKFENNGMVVQSVSQEERQSGVKGPILGNVKIIKGDSQQNTDYDQEEPEDTEEEETIPF